MADNPQDQKDYRDYLDYQKYQQGAASALTPPPLQDFHTPKDFVPDVPPGQSETWASKVAKFTGNPDYNDSPEIAAAKEKAAKLVGDDLGIGALAMPVEAAPAALMKLVSYLGKGGAGPLLSRLGINTGIGAVGGAVGNPQDRVGGAVKGGLISGVASGAAEGLGSLGGAIKRPYETSRLAANPVKMQDTALSAIRDATEKLRASEAANLSSQLGDKTLSIDTTRIRGISPEIDEILNSHAGMYGDIPSEVTMPAEQANKIRSLLDQEMTYKKLGPFAQNAETATRDARISPLAAQLREQVHGVSPEVSDTLNQWSENLNAARNIDKRAESAPVTVLTSPSIDRRALLQKVDSQVGTKLESLGDQLNAAKNLSNAVHDIKPMKALGTIGLEALRGAGRGSPNLGNPAVIQSLFGPLQNSSKK